MFNGTLGYWVLRKLRPPRGDGKPIRQLVYGLPYAETFRSLMGPGWEGAIRGKTVLDFGCGNGRGCVELVQHGAGCAIGVDVRQDRVDMAQELARKAGVDARCHFGTQLPEDHADYAVSVDAFEHFDDPEGVLRTIWASLVPGGAFVVSFGPTWYHPYGGHFFSVFPWSHLMFSERAQIRWRAEFKDDGATRFTEVEGGLNCMTIRRFERMATNSGFTIATLRLVPIRRLRWLRHRVSREFTTAMVECLLVKPSGQAADPLAASD